MKPKIKTKIIDLLVIVVLSIAFGILTTFIPNHNVWSYILGMIAMATIGSSLYSIKI